jgi:hypothetical protein
VCVCCTVHQRAALITGLTRVRTLLPLPGRPQGSPCPSPPILPRRQRHRVAIAHPTLVRSPYCSLPTTLPPRPPLRRTPPCCPASRTTPQASLDSPDLCAKLSIEIGFDLFQIRHFFVHSFDHKQGLCTKMSRILKGIQNMTSQTSFL